MRGPIDYIIVGFTENNFSGAILKELAAASEQGTIAVLAIALVARDKDGNVAAVEALGGDPEVQKLAGSLNLDQGLISDEDIEEVGELLEDNTSAGLLIIEQLWAKGLKKAIIDANGVLLDEGRIHPEASQELDDKEGK